MEASLIQVIGKRRRGKSSLVVAMVVKEYMKNFNDRYEQACEDIMYENMIKGTTFPFPPQEHVVFSNLHIKTDYPVMESYPISGFQFAIKNKAFKTKKIVPYGVYIFDEAQKYFDSKGENKELPFPVTRLFELSGQKHLKIFLITQRLMRLNSDIREIVDKFIYVEDSIHTFKIKNKKIKVHQFIDEGELIHTKWVGRQFSEEAEVQQYLSGNKDVGEKFTYEFNGDIRDYYDPYQFASEVDEGEDDEGYEEYNYYEITSDEKPKGWADYKKEVKNGRKEKNTA